MHCLTIQVYRYQLIPKATKHHPRDGALLKFTFVNHTVGYADCHPWPELGDKILNEQLHMLACQQYTPLTKRSVHYAQIDAQARHEKRSLLNTDSLPCSHHLVTDLYNFDPKAIVANTIKFKVGNDPTTEAKILTSLSASEFAIRLDCNEKLSQEQFHQFLGTLAPIHQQIDYIEDPYPYHPNLWQHTRDKYRVPLACDRSAAKAAKHPESFDVLIWKPAIEEKPPMLQEKRVVVTSYLDHPLGQTTAAYEAALHCGKETCGLNSHLVYQENLFSKSLWNDGTGFGFDTLLKNLDWQPLLLYV